MPFEPISPELVLVDPELGARARSALPGPAPEPRRRAAVVPAAAAPAPGEPPQEASRGRYPLWARITAALWILVLGILIGGAAIPHAQDKPHLLPRDETVSSTVCKRPSVPIPENPPHLVTPNPQTPGPTP